MTLPGAWNSPVSFEFTMGGSGTLLADIPALDKVGVKKFDVFVPQSGQSGALRSFAQPMIDALGMELVNIIEIPPTAVEFTQFVQTAQNDGVQGIVLGLPEQTASQILDAMDSLNSDLKVAVSLGSFSQKTVAVPARDHLEQHRVQRRRPTGRDRPQPVADLQRGAR